MNIGKNWKFGVVTLILALGVAISCTRSISVPVSPSVVAGASGPTSTPTNTPTNTATNTVAVPATSTPTNTPTNTPSPTVTNTPNGPTFTPTNTPTQTPTATITKTPTQTPTATVNPLMISDFENGNGVLDPGPSATWTGSWFTSVNPGGVISPSAWADATPGAGGSAYSAHVTVQGSSVTQYANFGFNFLSTPTPVDISTGGYTGVIFDAKIDAGSGSELAVAFPDVDTATVAAGGNCASNCNGYHQANVCLTTSYQSVTVFYTQLSQPSWAPQVAFKPASVVGMSFNFPVGTDMGVWIDNLRLTTAAPPAAPGNHVISDFDFNAGGAGINPNLQNYVANPAGFVVNPPVWCGAAALSGPIVDCGGYSAPFAGRVNGYFTDAANSCYPSMQMVMNLCSVSGGVTTYYNLPPGLTGIQFRWKVNNNSTTGTTPAGIFLHYNNGNMDGTSAYGQCTANCWDDYVAPALSTTTGSWSLVQEPFSGFTEQYGQSAASPTDTCQPGGAPAYGVAFPYSGGCYNSTTIGFSWAAQSGNTAGTYTEDFQIDDVSFY